MSKEKNTQQPAHAAPGDVTDSEREVIETLLRLAYRAWCLADDTEDGEHGLTVTRENFDAMSVELDKLDVLPDDQPGYTMGEAAKARWALRRLIGATPPGDDAAGGAA